jgi:uncharacterized membrane protein YidH (DUF202 family)
MELLPLLITLVGIGFCIAGGRWLLQARRQQTSLHEALPMATLFFMIGLVALVIGVAQWLGIYMRPLSG